jgi:hypothetical protein
MTPLVAASTRASPPLLRPRQAVEEACGASQHRELHIATSTAPATLPTTSPPPPLVAGRLWYVLVYAPPLNEFDVVSSTSWAKSHPLRRPENLTSTTALPCVGQADPDPMRLSPCSPRCCAIRLAHSFSSRFKSQNKFQKSFKLPKFIENRINIQNLPAETHFILAHC